MTSEGPTLDDAPLALLLAPPFSAAGESACYSHLGDGGSAPDRSLTVLMTERPEHRLRGWREHWSGVPDPAVIVASQRPADPVDGVEVELLDDPGDLSWLGVHLTERLDEWPTAGRTGFCLDSLTALLQFVDQDPAVRFLEALHDHLAEAGVVGHVHMNPGAHERATVTTFEELADGVIAVEDGGPASPDAGADS